MEQLLPIPYFQVFGVSGLKIKSPSPFNEKVLQAIKQLSIEAVQSQGCTTKKAQLSLLNDTFIQEMVAH